MTELAPRIITCYVHIAPRVIGVGQGRVFLPWLCVSSTDLLGTSIASNVTVFLGTERRYCWRESAAEGQIVIKTHSDIYEWPHMCLEEGGGALVSFWN